MEITKGKLIGLLVAPAVVAIVIVVSGDDSPAAARACVWIAIGLALVWFPDELGSFQGYVGRGGNINKETPPALITLVGWFFIVCMPALMYALH